MKKYPVLSVLLSCVVGIVAGAIFVNTFMSRPVETEMLQYRHTIFYVMNDLMSYHGSVVKDVSWQEKGDGCIPAKSVVIRTEEAGILYLYVVPLNRKVIKYKIKGNGEYETVLYGYSGGMDVKAGKF